jgi:hypothetical protein
MGQPGYRDLNGRDWQTRLSPNVVADRSRTYGVIGLLTSVVVIGAGFGIAAIETGYRARALARQSGRGNPNNAVVGIALGVAAIVVGLAVGFAVACLLVWFITELTTDPCWPVKQHTGCY